ncbi:hypothetical protein JTE90_018664 [Oedothorax gibbosus]|uniref:Prohibitin n=1 Tax=Oedothorax gibbosus TaxID=931172 RepID=A0AAV6V1M1_9ARAC|nr:hypothetical protein JTE90_018664 [Oedothorax gibbosus]
MTSFPVDVGHRAVIVDKFAGLKPNVIGEGIHFLIPWVQRPIIFDVRWRPRKISVETGTKDLKTVHVTLQMLFRPVATELPKICTTLGYDYEEKVLPSITTKALKAVVARFDASEIITKRHLIYQKFCEELIERGSQLGLILNDISITRLTFSTELRMFVKMKQEAERAQQEAERAQQEAKRAQFLEKAEQHKKDTVITAEDYTQAAVLLAKAFVESG